jgi:hypothetical protein
MFNPQDEMLGDERAKALFESLFLPGRLCALKPAAAQNDR